MTREELLHRLGVPAFRFRCLQCGRYCPRLVTTVDMASRSSKVVRACAGCAKQIEERSRQAQDERVENQVQYMQVNLEYTRAQQRASSKAYLAACERMRRELGLL